VIGGKSSARAGLAWSPERKRTRSRRLEKEYLQRSPTPPQTDPVFVIMASYLAQFVEARNVG